MDRSFSKVERRQTMAGLHPVTRAQWLAIFGAMTLLAGVLIFCHAELRGAQYINRMHSILDEIGNSNLAQLATHPTAVESLFAAQRRESMDELWDSFFRERWWGNQVFAPVGAGMLTGSLLVIAAVTTWRFRIRTLLIATLYIALLIGIPFGIVRPRLHDPHISLQVGPGISYTCVRYYQGSTRRGGGPRWSFPLVNWEHLLVAVGAFFVTGTLALLLARQRHCQTTRNSTPKRPTAATTATAHQ